MAPLHSLAPGAAHHRQLPGPLLTLASQRAFDPARQAGDRLDAGHRFDRALRSLVSHVSVRLGSDVEELATYATEFRVGLQRALSAVITAAVRHPTSIGFFNEAVPGFTVMVYKKEWPPAGAAKAVEAAEGAETGPMNGANPAGHEPASTQMTGLASDDPGVRAAGVIIDQFFRRTGNQVLIAECEDALLVFFPVSDLKRNLKEMGVYHTDPGPRP